MSKQMMELAGRRRMLLALIMATITLGLLFSGWFTPTPGLAQQGTGNPQPNIETTRCVVVSKTTNCVSAGSISLVAPINSPVVCIGSGITLAASYLKTTGQVSVITTYINTGNSGAAACPPITNTFAVSPPVVVSNWWSVSGPGNYTNFGQGLAALFAPTNCGSGIVTYNLKFKDSLPCNTNIQRADSVTGGFTVAGVTLEADKYSIFAKFGNSAPGVSCDLISATSAKITVTVNPQGANPPCPVSLLIESITYDGSDAPTDLPPNSGLLVDNNDGTWTYTPWTEPDYVIHPRPMRVTIKPIVNGICAGPSIDIMVSTVYDHIRYDCMVANDYICAYNFIRFRYWLPLNLTLGDFPGGVTIVSGCTCGNVQNAAGCTPFPYRSVEFDVTSFMGTENYAASVVGHELKHTWAAGVGTECDAYRWEYDHRSETGMDSTDNYSELQDTLDALTNNWWGYPCP